MRQHGLLAIDRSQLQFATLRLGLLLGLLGNVQQNRLVGNGHASIICLVLLNQSTLHR
jgi:hypothetical protein